MERFEENKLYLYACLQTRICAISCFTGTAIILIILGIGASIGIGYPFVHYVLDRDDHKVGTIGYIFSVPILGACLLAGGIVILILIGIFLGFIIFGLLGLYNLFRDSCKTFHKEVETNLKEVEGYTQPETV